MNAKIKKYLLIFLKGILAGLSIGLGGFLYIVLAAYTYKIFASIAFSVGLFLVCFFSLQLYTGKIGNIFDEKKTYFIDLFIMLIGNAIGAYALGWILRGTNILAIPALANKIQAVCEARLIGANDPWWQALYLSVCCGILVFFAVYFYRTLKFFPLKVVGLVICVTLFVFLGFEHVIANIFYFGFGAVFDGLYALNLLICVIGNSLGAFVARGVVYLIDLLFKKIQRSKKEAE